MTQIPITLDIIETDAQLEILMLNEIAKEFNKRISSKMSKIRDRIRQITTSFLQNTHTYDSLIGGRLAYHFGIPAVSRQQRIDTIVQAVSNRMEIDFNPVSRRGKRFVRGITIKVLLNDLSEVLSLIEGTVTTEKGETLEWLRWLLTLGDRVIISEYDILFRIGRGRSGGAIMIPDDAGAWRVPPQFSGTLKDNWLTRAFKRNIQSYLSIIEDIIQSELQGI